MELAEETAKVHTHNQPYHEFSGELKFTDTGLISGIKH